MRMCVSERDRGTTAVEPLHSSPSTPAPMAGEVGHLVLQILQTQHAGDEAGDKPATAPGEDRTAPPPPGLSKSHRHEEGDTFTPKIILKMQTLYRGHPSL